MRYKLICDFCENFGSKTDTGHVNDHQSEETFMKICSAIKESGYDCEIYGGVPELIKAYNDNATFEQDTIFINLSDGTDKKYSRVQIPVLCDLLDIKYSGGGTFETALTTNKFYTSLAVREKGFLVPNSVLITDMNDFPEIPKVKSIIKPNSEGSSVGITENSICENKEDILKQVMMLLNHFSEVLIEEYIPGYDITCFVVGNDEIYINEVLAIKHHNKMFFTNEAMGYKEHLFETREFLSCSNVLPYKTEAKIKEISIQIKELLNIHDFCRIDYRVTEKQDVYFLEMNTVPAISEDSQVGTICKKLNISFSEFVELIIKTVTERFNHE